MFIRFVLPSSTLLLKFKLTYSTDSGAGFEDYVSIEDTAMLLYLTESRADEQFKADVTENFKEVMVKVISYSDTAPRHSSILARRARYSFGYSTRRILVTVSLFCTLLSNCSNL